MARQQTEISDEQELTAEEIGEMSDETEREIARSAFGDDEPTGDNDRSLEQMQNIEGQLIGDDDEQIEPEDEEPQDQEAAEAEPGEEVAEEPQEQPDDRGFIPTGRLRENTEARRIAERENQELRERIARLEGAQQAYQPQQPQPQQPQARPDPVLDPDGFNRWIDGEFERRETMRGVAALQEAAQDVTDGWKVAAAIDFVSKNLSANNPQHQAMAQRMARSANPVATFVSYWERNGGKAEIERIEAERREQRRAQWEALNSEFAPARRQSQSRTAIETDAPRHVVTRVPGKSLNGVSGHGGNGRNRVNDPEYETDGSEAAIFRSAFQD